MRHGPKPIASVIMPAHNASPWISRAVESCLGQSRTDWELIVVDDGSTDATAEVVRDFNDERIELVQTPGGNGPGGARNLALERVRGKYIVPLDADDAFHPERLAVLSRLADRHGTDTILFDRSIRSSSDPFLNAEATGSPETRAVPSARFIEGSPPCKPFLPAELIDRTEVRYPAGAIAAEDYAFIVKLLDSGGRLVEVGADLYWHRLRAGSLTRSSAQAVYDAQMLILGQLLEQCTTPAVLRSIAARKTRVDHLHAVSQVVEDLRDWRIGQALGRLGREPRLVIPTTKRLTGVMSYRLGRGRTPTWSR